jgi:uncharacterized tellurite resistance protein B-like protein
MAMQSTIDIPDITKYPWQRRRDYLMLVAAVASSDDELHADELGLLNRWMEEFRLPRKSREAVMAVATKGGLDRQRVARRLGATDLIYSLMLDMMGMAMADGVLMDQEIDLLRGIARFLKLDPIDFNILIEFIHSAHQASQLANPEPLYEHNIESAFELLHKRKVRIFSHTLLCVSSADFDQKLKKRWFQYQAANGPSQANRPD